MKINWKVRLRNKTWLVTFTLAVIAFIYQVLGLLEITPPVAEDQITQLIMTVIDSMALLGIVMDPTTKGAGDSDRAMTYEEPF